MNQHITVGILVTMLFLILYCQQKHGDSTPLKNYHHEVLPPPPDWAQNGVIYELYFRAFTPQGTIKAATMRLPELKKMGITIIWVMPIYPIGTVGRKGTAGSPYAVVDFRQVNPELGTADDFRQFVNTAHQLGLKVIMDIVPNHGAIDNVLTRKHPDWFMQDEQGNFTREVADWSDIIDFNYNNPHMRHYMRESMLFWIREFDIDGFRCDVAGMVPLDFWKETIPQLRKEKEAVYLLAEWEDPALLLAGFHSDYDWTLYHLLKDIRLEKKRTAEAITLVEEKDSLYPQNALPMRFLENHDEQRSMAVFGPAAIEAYATFLFTLPGIPLIYAGQEIGAIHRPSLFEKEPIRWAEGDTTLQQLYARLIHFRRNQPALTRGSYHPLQVAMLKGSVGAFIRQWENTVILVVSNLWGQLATDILIFLPEALKNISDWQPWNSGQVKQYDGNLAIPEMPGYTTWIFLANTKQKDSP